MVPKGGRLAYGGDRDIHIQESPADRVSFVAKQPRKIPYLGPGAERSSLGFRKSDTLSDSQNVPLKVKRHTGKRGTSDGDEEHSGLMITGEYFGKM
jgi:hypothetical protein